MQQHTNHQDWLSLAPDSSDPTNRHVCKHACPHMTTATLNATMTHSLSHHFQDISTHLSIGAT